MNAKCLAQTDIKSDRSPDDQNNGFQNDSYRSLQWTADGTCLLAVDYAHTIKTFVVPVDLLEERSDPLSLQPYSLLSSPEPVSAVVGVPFFDLQSPSTALVLCSLREQPLRLSSALMGDQVASYQIINPMTESYICPNALTFSLDGRHIIAGSESLISVFDISITGAEPLHSIRTGPKRSQDDRWNPSTSLRGIISTLATERSSNILAAGTFSRQVGLYEAGGTGESVGSFSVARNAADADVGGSGITEIKWSPCGRYLYIAERKSNGMLLYDIRNTGELLAWCKGRHASTNQRLAFDLAQAQSSDGEYRVWAGGTDGVMRVWEDAHLQGGAVEPIADMQSHEEPVSGTALHRSGGVLATASGPDYFKQEERQQIDESLDQDATIKIWLVDH